MGNPAVAVDDVRGPALFLDRLQDAAGEEDGSFAVVLEELSGSVGKGLLAAEIILATRMTSGRSTSSMMMFMPERRITSCSWCFRSLMQP